MDLRGDGLPEHKVKEEMNTVYAGTGEKLDWNEWPRPRQGQPLGVGAGGERAAAQMTLPPGRVPMPVWQGASAHTVPWFSQSRAAGPVTKHPT